MYIFPERLYSFYSDISTKEFKEASSKLMASKTSKKDVDRVLIVITDDKAFDASGKYAYSVFFKLIFRG